MECPLCTTMRNSNSFHTSCRSRAVSGGHIASLPPWIAMVGGSGKEEDAVDDINDDSGHEEVREDDGYCGIRGGNADEYHDDSMPSASSGGGGNSKDKNDLYRPMQ